MTERQTLLLIDGHALAFRAFHALREAGLRASTGEPTYAVFGFISIMLNAVEEYRPEHLAVSFDIGRTFRDDLYDQYKAGRSETPEEFHPQLERIQQVIRALNIPIYTAEGFEADDVIGTLSVQAAQQQVGSIILTGDTDTLQLVNDHVRVLLANPYAKGNKNTTMYDEPMVVERYKGLKPTQLADLRGLKGDTSDNIPGVKGIGEAGAIALLLQFGSVEGLYDHLDEAPNRYKKHLQGQREAAMFSKHLATIVCDAPVQLELAATALGDYDRAAVLALFQEMEMGATLVKKLPAAGRAETYELPDTAPKPAANAAAPSGQIDMFEVPDVPAAPPAAPTGPQQMGMFESEPVAPARQTTLVTLAVEPPKTFGDYRALRSEADLAALVDELAAAPGFAFDTETDGLRPLESALVGISVATKPGSAVYIPFGHTTGETQLSAAQVLEALRPFFSDPNKPKYAHNAKFDIELMQHAGVPVEGLEFDTMIAAALLDKRKGLKDLAFYELRLPEPMTDITELIGKGKTQITFDQVPVEPAAAYAAADADMTLRLVEALRPQLAALPKVESIFQKLEMPLLPVLVRMESAGIGIDEPYMRALGQRLGEQLAELEKEIYAFNNGMPFNIGSGQQLADVLFNKVGLDKTGVDRTKTGQFSLTAQSLEQLRERLISNDPDNASFQIIDLVLQHRQLTKLKSTYVDALPELINRETKRIHTSYSQLGAATGRLSSADPNLQNIPTRTEAGRDIRRGFVATPGHKFVAADYSQIELRVLAHITGDANLTSAFIEGQDIHAATASQLFGVEPKQVDKNQRRVAKCVAAGTLVATEHGVIPIEQLGQAAVGEVTDVGFAVAQEGKRQQQATGFYNGGVQPTLRITTKRGYVLEATARHQVRSIDAEGNYIWRRLGDVQEGEYVALGRGAMLFGVDQAFNATYFRRNDKRYEVPTQLTPAFARFLGYFVAEGNVMHARSSDSVIISNKDPEVLADLRALSEEVFGVGPKELVDKNDVTRMSWHSSRLHDLLEHLGTGNGAANKRIPDVIMQGSYTSVCGFLQAYFEGDGSISKSYISAGTKSLTLVRQLQTLLLNLGIVCYLETRDIEEHGRHYRLRVIGRESRQLFAEHIGFVSERKRSRLAALIQRQVTQEPITLPFQRTRLRRLYPQTKRDHKEAIHTCIRTLSPSVELTYRRLDTILQGFQQDDDADVQVLQEHFERNVFYDSIARIETSESQVYDLVVPENNTYLANGFVSHNTVVFGVIYGISAFGLAPRINASRSEAQALIDALFARFPGIRGYIDQTLAEGKRDGFVQSLFGRRRSMPELRTGGPRRQAAEREAINAPIQATAADIMKIAMIRVDAALRREQMKTRMLLQVHDELILEAPDDEVERAAKLVCDEMSNAFALSVPLGVDVESGPNWLDMHDIEV